MEKTDQKHLEAVRTGDTPGLRQIYSEFLPRVAALITRNGGSYDDARDVFQDALVVLFEKCRDGNFKLTSSFSTLLFGVCRNLWGNRLQKKSRTEVTLSDDFKFTDSADLTQAILDEEENRIFWDAFRQLGADCRQLLQLFFDKKSMEEIAETMKFGSVGYAKKRKFQCKEYLLAQVKADPRYQEYLI
jgi:RNA polymerase sigma factor (sigma-70 family)